jgi:hypothetical protein
LLLTQVRSATEKPVGNGPPADAVVEVVADAPEVGGDSVEVDGTVVAVVDVAPAVVEVDAVTLDPCDDEQPTAISRATAGRMRSSLVGTPSWTAE